MPMSSEEVMGHLAPRVLLILKSGHGRRNNLSITPDSLIDQRGWPMPMISTNSWNNDFCIVPQMHMFRKTEAWKRPSTDYLVPTIQYCIYYFMNTECKSDELLIENALYRRYMNFSHYQYIFRCTAIPASSNAGPLGTSANTVERGHWGTLIWISARGSNCFGSI
jgi:hypothetical protein